MAREHQHYGPVGLHPSIGTLIRKIQPDRIIGKFRKVKRVQKSIFHHIWWCAETCYAEAEPIVYCFIYYLIAIGLRSVPEQ
jgi:hypothetical protein